ncbi:MAG: TetR/AcrR family transcriptional regulator [Prevotellaceae bacterium]|jgi:AcrR family transcriptional regulator|nr:TetR/AcrR family transcriptional regulator [Prevotellaceae bacterium]
MENLKNDIINTAAALFKKYGLRSVSIDDVCKELSISKKTFYNYFRQKEDLIVEILHKKREDHKNKTQKPWIYESQNIIDILMEFDKTIKNNAEENRKHLSMIFDLEKYYPKIFKQHEEAMKAHNLELVKNLINKGIEESVFREDMDRELTAMFLANQFHTMMALITQDKKINHGKMFGFISDVVIRILANEKGMNYYLKNYHNR